METVNIETVASGVCTLTMNRPEARNALSMQLIGELTTAFRTLDNDRDCRVIILTGAGASFCAGADLKHSDGAPGTEDMTTLGLVYKTQEYLAELMLSIRECSKPVIAAINGAAVGGGFAMALACDICVAASNATFGSVFIKVGLSSCDVGTSYLLPRIVGVARAAELMLTGRIFGADEAQMIGLLHKVEAAEDLLASAVNTAMLIAENNEYGVWMTKKGLSANLDAPSLRHAMELENRTQVLGYFTGNMEEAVDAFGEGRKPSWKKL